MSIAVIIPSKTASNFKACAAAVRQHEPEAKIILIDDKGQVGSKVDYDFRLETEGPFSFPRAANFGFQKAIEKGFDSFVLLNDDAILCTPAGFSLLEVIAQQNQSIGIISATTNVAGNKQQWPQGKGLRLEANAIAFVCVLIPRRTVEKVGFMDEQFGGLTEDGKIIYGCCDTDYSRRIRNAGLAIAIHDGCFVDHETLPSSFVKDCGRNASISREMYRQKWGDLH